MRPYQEKKLSTESIPSDQLNYSLFSNFNNNGMNITQNTSPISSDTTKEATAPVIPICVQSSQFWSDVNTLQDQIINEALAAAISQSIVPNVGVNLQGYPAFDQNTNYEEEYYQAFMMNEIMIKKLAQYCEEINNISERAKRLQEIFEQKLMKVNQSYSANDLSRPIEPISQNYYVQCNKAYSQEALSNNSFNPKNIIQRNSLNQEESSLHQKKVLSESISNNNIEKINKQKKDLKGEPNNYEGEVSFSELNGHSENYSQTDKNRQKKLRRCAAEIQKNYECPYEECKKTYGSEVSLNLHIKIKHNGGNKTERERLARQMFMAQINGKEVPQASLNLPPGFLEQYKDGLKKVKRCREAPYSSNNLRPIQSNILLHSNSKSETQLKVD